MPTEIAAAWMGAACPAAGSPWLNVAAPDLHAGTRHAHGQSSVPAAGTPGVRRPGALRLATAQTAQLTPTFAPEQTAALMAAELLPVGVNGTRKQTNVHKTRINAGGYGAMGPHPERERLA